MTTEFFMMKKENILNWLLMAGMVTITLMALLPLLNVNQEWMRWAFAAGAIAVLAVRLLQRPAPQANLRVRRLLRINVMSALLFCASAGMTFYRQGTTDWVAFLMAGAVLQIYVSFMLDHEARRQ